MVRGVQDYFRWVKNSKLAGTDKNIYAKKIVLAYLDELGRKEGIKNWQFQQAIKALEILFCDVFKLS